ncbi:MAG: linear amide C-N hydrolase [Collinsella aerofaciens]
MCTSIRFTDNSGHMYLGRNLDWSFDYGQQVRVMPRGFHIPYSFIDDATAAHAAIGMCIDYKNYPMFFDCGNDAGLAVAGLNSPGYAEYAEGPVDGKTNIAAYEFPCGWQRRSRRSMRSRPRCATR